MPFCELRQGGAGCNYIHTDAQRAGFYRESLAELGDGCFREGIESVSSDGGIDGSRCDIDDAAAIAGGFHGGHGGLAAKERPLDVDSRHAIKFAFADFRDGSIRRDPGHVAHDVKASKLGRGPLYQCLDLFWVCDVDGLSHRLTTGVADSSGDSLGSCFIQIAHHHPGSRAGKDFRYGLSNPTCSTGDDGGTSAEIEGLLDIMHALLLGGRPA